MDDGDEANQLVSLSRVNYEPVVLLGLTLSELFLFTGIYALAWVPAMQVGMLLIGKWMYGLPLGLAMMAGSVVLTGLALQKVKRRRPVGYYQLFIKLHLEALHLTSTGMIRRSGLWDVKRHKV